MSDTQETKKTNVAACRSTTNARNYTHELIKWGLIVFITWITYLFAHKLVPFFVKDWIPEIFYEKGHFQMGTFGDYFGALNALFAGLAFAGIIVTIRQQSADLQATKDEMKEQTRQFKREDIYKRLEIIRQLKPSITLNSYFAYVPDYLTKSPEQAVSILATFANDIIRSFVGIQKGERPNRIYIDTLRKKRECLYICQLQLEPWLKSISCLLEDISMDYKNDKKETIRLFRVVLATFDMATQQMISLYENKYVSPSVMPALKEAGLTETTDNDNCSGIRNKMIRELFIDVATTGKSLEQAFEEWDNHCNTRK